MSTDEITRKAWANVDMSQTDQYKILTLNNIASLGLERFPQDRYRCGGDVDDPHAILVRSANLLSLTPNPNLLAVGRAGAGTNNIDGPKLAELGIPVFNTPGANANAVKELVLSGLLISTRNLVGAMNFVRDITHSSSDEFSKTVEDGKKRFAGRELPGRTLGIVGLGKIGGLVADVALKLGMRVIGYDPGITVDAAWGLPAGVVKASSVESLLRQSDFVSLHVPLNDATRHLINADRLGGMRDDSVLLNFSRGAVVDNEAVVAALNSGALKQYICDFPHADLMGVSGVIALPHMGASTQEAEENCAVMVVNQVRDYLDNGNIVNSVNLPDVSMSRESAYRLAIINKNIPNMVSQISSVLGELQLNIQNMINKSANDLAVTLVDVESPVEEAGLNAIKNISGVIRVRYLNGY